MNATLDRRATLAGLAAAGTALALPGVSRAEGIAIGVFSQGPEDAPVTVLEYVSLTCPHCARFHEDVYPTLKRDYVDTGKIRLELREVYFDRVGLWAAMLARCGGEDRYFGFVDMLLTQQEEWSRSENLLAEFQRMGRVGGLTDAQVEACVSDEAGQRALVEQFQEYREDPLLTGTPTLVVNGAKVDNPTEDRLKAAIDAALGS